MPAEAKSPPCCPIHPAWAHCTSVAVCPAIQDWPAPALGLLRMASPSQSTPNPMPQPWRFSPTHVTKLPSHHSLRFSLYFLSTHPHTSKKYTVPTCHTSPLWSQLVQMLLQSWPKTSQHSPRFHYHMIPLRPLHNSGDLLMNAAQAPIDLHCWSGWWVFATFGPKLLATDLVWRCEKLNKLVQGSKVSTFCI